MGRAETEVAGAISRGLFWVIRALSVVAFVTILSSAGGAVTRLVNNQPGCSDTSGNPYCTINAAVAVANPGDIVSVASGTYPGRVLVNRSGTSSAPITITTSQGAIVTSTSQGFDLSGAAWVTINGFSVDQTVSDGFRCNLCSRVILSNNRVTGPDGNGFLINNSSDTTLTSNQIEDTLLIGISVAGSMRITVTGGHVKRSGLPQSGLVQNGIKFSTSTDSLVDGTEVANNSDIGVYIIDASSGIRIKRVIAHHNARQFERIAAGIESRSAGNFFESNISYENEDSGINMRWGGADGFMVNNVTYLNGDHGIDVLESPRPIIVNNTVYLNETSGINIEGSSINGYVYNNISVDNALSTDRKKGEINIGGSSPVLAADYNLFSACCGSVLYVYNGTTYNSLSALQSATPAEDHGIQALPGWVDQANNNFHLNSTSPAIDSAKSDAIATSERDHDADGNNRCDYSGIANTGSGFITYMDRGAYEFTGTGCTGTDTTPPSVPANLAGTGFSPTQINLTWSASTDNVAVTGYKLFRNGASTPIATVTGTSFSDTGRTPNTTYTYTVSAFDAANNNSAQSGSISVTTPLTDTVPPSVPAGLAGTAISPTQINLTWTASTDNVAVISYKVFRNGGTTPIATVTSTSFSDAGLTPNTPYSYRVSAVDAANNNSALSASVSVTTQTDTATPSVPTNLAGTAISPVRIDLTWTASTDNVAVTGYKVFLNGGTTPLATVTTNSFSHTGLTPNTTYTYQVSAFDAANNNSNKTTAVPVTTPADTTAPTVPSNLAAAGVSPTSIGLSWDASTDIVGVTGYKVFRDGATTPVATVTGLIFNDTGLTPSSTHSYEVSAVDAAGNNSAHSAPASASTLPDTTPPSPPTSLTGNAVSQTEVHLSWTAATDNIAVAGYKVFRDGSEIGTTTATGFNDASLTAASTYNYAVLAFDAAGNNSAQTTPISVTTPPAPDTTPPSIPQDLAATPVSMTQIDLTWTESTDNVGVTGYKVFRTGNPTPIATVTELTYSDTGLVPNTLYSYTVVAFDAANNISDPSAEASATTLPDIEAPSIPAGLNGAPVSPNQINISWNASTDNVAVTGYQVFRDSVEIATVTSTTFNDTGLTPDTSYSYAVLAFDAANNSSAQSDPISRTTPPLPDTTPPSVPTGLAGTAVSMTEINLTWDESTDNAGVTGYKIFRNSVQVGTATGTTFNDTGLTANTAYNYQVSAYDAAGNNSDRTAAISVSTLSDTTPPTVPTNLAGTAASQTQINLSWTASNDNVGVIGYKVFRDSVEIATVAGTTFNNTGLTANTTYSYAVSAYDAAGNDSAASTAVSVTTPPAVTTITWEGRVSASANDAEQVVGGSTNLTSSDLELVMDTSLQVVGLRFTNVTIPKNATITDAYVQFTTDEVSTGTISLSIAGEAADNSVIFTTAANNISNRAKTTAVASWAPPAWNTVNEAGANQRTPNLASVIQQIINRSGWSGGNALSIVVSGSGKRVARAFDTSSGTQAPLLHIEYNPPSGGDTTPPSVPANLAGSAVSQTQIDLSWTASTDNFAVTGYRVFRNSAEIATVTGTTFSNIGLTANTTYSYAVSAYDAASNNSAQTSAISVTTPPASTTVTWQARISASANDAEEIVGGTSTDLNSTDLEIVTDGTALQLVGLRFTGLTIPRNSVISNAYIQFTVDETSSDATTLSLAAETVDNSAIFTTADNNISSRVRAGPTVSWIPPAWNVIDEAGANQRTPNLGAAIQQIINRAGWTSGNALSIIVTGSGKRVARAFNISGGAKAPLMHIEYTPP